MKKQINKKLALRRVTIASLNESQQMLVMAGGQDASDATVCHSNCAGCGGGGVTYVNNTCNTCYCVSINDTCDCQRPKQTYMCGTAVCSAQIGCTATKHPDCNGAGQ